MGECKLNHSHEDVVKKLESQKSVLPIDVSEKLDQFLNDTHPQETLNTLFHLLKKYDLASSEEQQDRNKQLLALVS
ncbi:group-specific protein [Lentibacillus lipolyticus]|nr:group-specific protein [Lentibacillus lipolyticus]